MKIKVWIIILWSIIVCCPISSYAQQTIPYKTLDSISVAIRKMQTTINNVGVRGKYTRKNDSGRIVTYYDTTFYNFPEDNFGINEDSYLAYKTMSSKKGADAEYYSRGLENIDLTAAKNIFWGYYNDSSICGVSLGFPNASLKGYRLEGEKKVASDFSGLSFFAPVKNKKSIQTNSLPLLVQLLIKLYDLLCTEKGLFTPEQAAQELKDLKSMSNEDFLAAHPNSIFSQRAKNLISQAKNNLNDQPQKTAAALGTPSNGSLADEISRLFDLKQKGALTEAEFDAAKAKVLSLPAKPKNTTQASVTPKVEIPSKKDLSFTINGNNYCAIKAPANSEFIGRYEYPGTEPVFWGTKRPGEPIVQLDATESGNGRTGKFQAHGIEAFDILWWLESDCNGKEQVINGDLGDRRVLIVKFLTGNGNYPVGSYSRMILDKFKTGKIVILGEREKVK
jgi:hypothetical protein